MTALGCYVASAALTAFGLLENPHTWSAWWMRNFPILFDRQLGWSAFAKVLPLMLVGVGLATTSLVHDGKGRALRWIGAALVLGIVVAEALTWPSPGCPPT